MEALLSAKHKRLLSQSLPIAVIWLLTGWVFLWTEQAIIGHEENTPDSAISLTPQVFLFASISVILIGFLVGFIEYRFINALFKPYRFVVKLLGKFVFYLLFMELLVFVTFIIAASIEQNSSMFSSVVWDKYQVFFGSITHASTLIQLAFSMLLSLFYVEVSEHLGHSVLTNFITGKYHRPKSETRLFMFSDMKSSTHIAETLGHDTYFEFLASYYNDLSDAILRHKGEVYQYVGDEIVLTWPSTTARFVPLSLDCFYAMKADLERRRPFYLQQYGVYPDFKAAIHIGEVTTGEIGALKKDIFFTGDVLNTAARLQSECQTYGVDLLVSKAVVDAVPSAQYPFESLGSVQLKGKTQAVEVFLVGV
ncbi:adenylate/guanylate cyclase domain-containing protein [Winogradskyella sp. MH6]|uniref:adenylate/guanylate cyclase domain-containing protein n=1 Tax=Winogradskyella sp. MH6 TaxID=2929510 RepID=UPI001FB25608|nr:adenylate/guanylate cyclase domain-containing protein [Winogradskyella sp. MH6]